MRKSPGKCGRGTRLTFWLLAAASVAAAASSSHADAAQVGIETKTRKIRKKIPNSPLPRLQCCWRNLLKKSAQVLSVPQSQQPSFVIQKFLALHFSFLFPGPGLYLFILFAWFHFILFHFTSCHSPDHAMPCQAIPFHSIPFHSSRAQTLSECLTWFFFCI